MPLIYQDLFTLINVRFPFEIVLEHFFPNIIWYFWCCKARICVMIYTCCTYAVQFGSNIINLKKEQTFLHEPPWIFSQLFHSQSPSVLFFLPLPAGECCFRKISNEEKKVCVSSKHENIWIWFFIFHKKLLKGCIFFISCRI